MIYRFGPPAIVRGTTTFKNGFLYVPASSDSGFILVPTDKGQDDLVTDRKFLFAVVLGQGVSATTEP